jgi:hypothetical protein
MAFELSAKAEVLSQQTNIQQQIVIQIAGIDLIFGALEVLESVKIGDDLTIGEFIIGGTTVAANSRDYIDLGGTTNSISQQIEISKGGAGSVSKFNVKLIDKNGELSELFKINGTVPDMLAREADVYFGFKESAFPTDFIRLFNGSIDSISFGSGFVKLSIAAPDTLKRQVIYPLTNSELLNTFAVLSGNIDDTQTSISLNDGSALAGIDSYLPQYVIVEDEVLSINSVTGNDLDVTRGALGTTPAAHSINDEVTYLFAQDSGAVRLDSTFNLVEPADACKSFIRVNDEIFEYTNIVGQDLTGLTRGQLDSLAANHSGGDSTDSIYTFSGDPISLALKLMISGTGNFIEGQAVPSFVQIDGATTIPNGILITQTKFDEINGITSGDLVTITGATDPQNNVVSAAIISAVESSLGTVLILEDNVSLVAETDSNAVMSIKSPYDTLNQGGSMSPRYIDIERHKELFTLLNSQFPSYEVIVEDDIQLKEFLETEIYQPAGGYVSFRKGRSSVSFTIPPLSQATTQYLTEDNVLNASDIAPTRSVNRDFYNAIAYKYNRSPIDDKFTAGNVVYSARSQNRITTSVKPLVIESLGLRASEATTNFVNTQGRRFLDRFQFGAERLNSVEVNFSTGWNMEIGDTCFFGSSGLQVTDSTNGTRDFTPRLFEVVNRSFNYVNGKIRLDLLDVKYLNDGRYGVISPSSKLASGSTVSRLKIKPSYGVENALIEREKWRGLEGQRIEIHSPDYSFRETVTILEFPLSNQDEILISPDLSSAPLEDYLINIPEYPEDDAKTDSVYKDQFCFWNYQIEATAGTNSTFDVGLADVDKFRVGAFVRVHNDDFTDHSIETPVDEDRTITEINGQTITLDESLAFTIQSGYKIELIGFRDEGDAYRIF